MAMLMDLAIRLDVIVDLAWWYGNQGVSDVQVRFLSVLSTLR